MKRKSTLVDSVSAEPKVSAVGRKRLSLTVIPQNKANRLRNVSSEPVYAEPPARRSQSPTRQRATFNFSLLTAFAVLLCLMFGGTAWGQTTLWSENFEGGSMPSGWTTDGSGSWSVATAVNSTHPSSAGEGTYCAQIKHGSTGNATKLITPAIDLSSVTSAELSFMHAEQSWSGDIDGLKVYYRTSTSGTWTQLVEYIDAYASWTTESEIILPNLSSTYQLAFEYIDNYGYGLGIDDIKIVQGASCVKPINIAVNTPTTHGATVSWTGTSDSYIVMVGEANVSANYNFETGTMPAAFTNNSTNAWSVELNNHSGAYCAKSAGGFTSTNSDLSLTVTLSSAGFVSFSAMASSESGWDYGRFLIDGTQKIETSGTSNNWTDYSYPLEAGQHTLIWRYYKDGSGDQGDDCFYVDDIVVISEPASWHQYPATSSPYTINDATNINSATPYMVYVIGVCGGEQSDPSATADFTTEVSCPNPTNIAVNNPTAHGATVSWTGTSDSYIVMVGEANVNANYNFETGTIPATFTNTSTNAWSVVSNNHSGAYCAKSAGGFTSTNSDLSLTVTLSSAGSVSFSAMASSESGWDYGRFFIDGNQKFETSGTSNNWTDYSYPLEAGQHTLTWRYYKDSGTDNGDDCFYVDDIVVISEPTSWHQYPAASSPYTINDATNINSATPYMVYVIGVCGGEQSDPSTTANFTTEVSCPKPTGLTVGTITTTTATISWTPGGSETAWQYTLDDGANWNDFASAPTGTTTKTGTITGLSAGSSYTVKVRAYCSSSDQSNASNGISFTTPLCDPANMCELTIVLTDAYGDGGGSMQVLDASTSEVLGSYTNSGASAEFYLSVCNGTPLSFVYASTDSWSYENGFVITDPNGDVIVEHVGCRDSGNCTAPSDGVVATYTVNCSSCPNPTNLAVNGITASSAIISWIPNGGQVQFSTDGTNWETMNTNSKTLPGLTAATNYTVYVRTNCGGGDYSGGVSASFTTALCDPANMCEISYELGDSNNDGWDSDAAINVVDVATSEVIGTIRLASGGSGSGTLSVCNGRDLRFVWINGGTYDYECSYTIKDANDEVIFEGSGTLATVNYTVNCGYCPKPTSLTVSNITGSSADISWTGSAESYNLRYGKVYTFDDGTMQGWTTIDADGDGYDWVLGSAIGGIYLVEGASLTGEGHNSSTDLVSSGSYENVNTTVLTPNNYLVSPQITFGTGASISFWAKGQDVNYAAEHFGIAVSTTGTNASDFSLIPGSEEYIATSDWVQYTVDLSGYSGQGYVAIRHYNISDMFILDVDDILLFEGSSYISGINSSSYTLTGLAQNTTYVAQVQSDCGSEGTSGWTGTTFTTPFQIATVEQWNQFCGYVNNCTRDFYGETVFLAANIGPVSTMAGTSSCPFRGTFEGQGYKINVGISSSEQGAAPFRYISGATIQNLKVDGTITTTAHHASGLVGFCVSGSTNTIQNCHISTDVTNSNAYNGDYGNNYMGGLIGHNMNATTNIIGCVYDGTLSSEGFKGGFVGFTDDENGNPVSITIRDSYFAGNYSPAYVTDGGNNYKNFSPVGARSGHVFTVNLNSSNFYYNTDDPQPDGADFVASSYDIMNGISITGISPKHGYSVTGESPVTVAMNGTPTTYNVSGITAYSTGIEYDGTIYGGSGDELALSLSGSSCGYETDHGSLSGSGNPYSLTMEAYNTKISAPVYTVTVNAGEGGTASGSGTYNCGENATLTATPSSGYYFYQWNDGNTDNPRTINITSNVTYTATFKQAPLTINNTTDWNNFAEAVSHGYNYSSKTVTLTNDIMVNTIIPGSPWAVSSGFHGTFDGQCHTITINNYTTSDEFVGLFRYTYGATIINLIVDGTINSSNIRAGGLIGLAQATTTFTNCRSNVTINSTYSGIAQNGGFVGAAVNKITFEGCAFSGSLNGANATQNGGFVGNYYYESNYSHTYTNCLFVPLSMNIGTTNSSTFAPTTYNTFTNCYYTEALGTQQGTQVYSVTGDGVGVSLQGSASTSYSCSGLDFYSHGLTFNGTIYGSNLALSLSYEGLISGYTTSNGDLSGSSHTGVNDEYTLASLSGNAIINQTPCPFDNPPAGLIWKGGTDGDVTNWEIATNWVVYNESETRYQLAGSAPSESSNVFIIRNDACNIEGVPSLSSNKECNDITLAGIGVNIADGKYLTVNGTATFTSGIVTGDVTFGSGATVSGASTSSYVNGKVTRNGMSGEFTFPTGTATLYAPFKATSSSASNVSVQYAAGHDGMPDWWNHSGNLYDAGLNHASDRENWQLSASASTELSSIILYWNESDNHSFEEGNDALNSYLNVAAVKRNGFNWQNLGRASIEGDYDGFGSITAAEPLVIEISGAKAAGEGDYFVTFASSNNNLVLPIELTSFTATCDGRSTLIEWTTATERNNDYFSLERSDDAINFVEIARIAGAGNSIDPVDYAYTDYGIHGGDNYYRLVQVDYDGTRTVSEVIVANCIELEVAEPDVQAYPNPFNDELTVVLDNFGNRAATIEVYDMLGKLIYTNKIAAPQNSYETILNLSNLPPAAYTVRVSTNDFVINKNVVKN